MASTTSNGGKSKSWRSGFEWMESSEAVAEVVAIEGAAEREETETETETEEEEEEVMEL